MIIIFVGPIACGKTTQRLLLKNYLINNKKHTFTFSLPPFSYISYFLLSSIRSIVSIYYGKQRSSNNNMGHPLAFLETDYKPLISRFLKALVLVDQLQALTILLLVKIFSKLRFILLIEDFIPTIMLEHFGYFRLYRNSVVSNSRILAETSKILLRSFMGNTNDLACIYLGGSSNIRLLRSLKRGYRVVEPRTFHDRIHEKALLPLLLKLCTTMVVVDTDNKSIRDVFYEIRVKTSDYLGSR